MKTDSSLYGARNPIANDDKNCGVRALAVAMSISMASAYWALADVGRRHRGSTNAKRHMEPALAGLLPLSRVMKIENFYQRTGRKPTLAQWLRAHPTGIHVVLVTSHYVTVINGVVHNHVGNGQGGARKRVQWAGSIS